MCNLLIDVYQNVFEKEFNYSSFDDRIKLQKTVYILENMGLEVGNYGFVWYKHGPYSQRLQNDAYRAQKGNEVVEFSDYANNVINRLKQYIEYGKETHYATSEWLEAIASLDFMITRQFMEDEIALRSLMERKPHLNNGYDNQRALDVAKQIRDAVI